MDFSSFSRIRRRTSSWVKLVHLHTVFSARSPAYSSPSVTASRFSTRPVHEPQLADALQLARTASSVTAPFRMQATTPPLDTPLQPQISASSESAATAALRSEEHTSELQSLMRISYAVFCLKKKTKQTSCILSYMTTYQRKHISTYSYYNTYG